MFEQRLAEMRMRESADLGGFIGRRERLLECRLVVADETVERSRRPLECIGDRARRDECAHERAPIGRRRARCLALFLPRADGTATQVAAKNVDDLSSEVVAPAYRFARLLQCDCERSSALLLKVAFARRLAFKRALALIALSFEPPFSRMASAKMIYSSCAKQFLFN